MKLTLESTDQIVTLQKDGAEVQARVWQGLTERGIAIHCFITTVGVRNGQPPEVYEQFEKELKETPKVRPDYAIPLRFFID